MGGRSCSATIRGTTRHQRSSRKDSTSERTASAAAGAESETAAAAGTEEAGGALPEAQPTEPAAAQLDPPTVSCTGGTGVQEGPGAEDPSLSADGRAGPAAAQSDESPPDN